MVVSFGWLETWGKTPMDFGLDLDDLDPWWHEAMMIIKEGVESQHALAAKKSSPRSPRPH